MDRPDTQKNSVPEETGGGRRKPGRLLLRLLAALLVVAVALGAVAAVVWRDRLNADSIKRWFRYRTMLLSDSGQAEAFPFDGDAEDSFALVDGDLLVCSRNTLSLYSGSGTRYVEQPVDMEHPAIACGGTSAVVYDVGGSELYVLSRRQLVWTGTGLEGILSARLNKNGLLTVVTQPGSSRGEVTVYDASCAPLATVRLTSAYVLDAALSDDGKTLAIVTIGQQDGTFASTLSLYALNAAQGGAYAPDLVRSLGSGAVLELRHTADRVWALTDQGLGVLGRDGQTVTADWDGRYLKQYTLAGDGFAAALLGKYQSGSQGELWVVLQDGTRHTLEIREQVLSLSAAGRYLAVLTGNRLDLYTRDLTLYASLTDTQGARSVLMQADGSAVLIAQNTARCYVP